MSTLEIATNTPQRVAIVIEKNKAGTWSLGSYLVMADGHRHRQGLGTFEDYADAAASLEKAWMRLST